MQDFKQILYVIFALVAGLIVLWWIGHAIQWSIWRKDQQRQLCVQQTHDAYFCNAEW